MSSPHAPLRLPLLSSQLLSDAPPPPGPSNCSTTAPPLPSLHLDAHPHCTTGQPCSVEDEQRPQPPQSSPAVAFRPSRAYALYCAVFSSLLFLRVRFVSLRWSVLLPLYRRVDLPGLRGFAVIELLLIAAYVAINGYFLGPLLYALVAPRTDFATYMVAMVQAAYRLGSVGTWNVLALWLPVTRHSLWNYAVGISFDRATFYHVWVSRLALLVLSLHALGLYAWMLWKGELLREIFAGGVGGKVPTGELALIGGLLLLIPSLEVIRRRWWELFMRTHYVGLLLFTVFGMLHDSMVWKVTLAGVALYGIDICIRTYQWTRPVEVVDMRMVQGEVTRVEWCLPGFQFEAGQFVLICLPLLSPFEWHPFSISSPPHCSTVVLHSRRQGEWTSRLESLARGFDPARPPRMYVEGPYGALTLPLPLYRHVLLVSGGMGVTPMLSVYHHLMQAAGGEPQVRGRGWCVSAVRFVWSVRDRHLIDSVWGDIQKMHAASSLLPTPVPSLLPQAVPCPSLNVPLSPIAAPGEGAVSPFSSAFHVTRGVGEEGETAEGGGWEVTRGRPHLGRLFAAMKRTMEEDGEGTGEGARQPAVRCAVLVCGPEALIQRCRRLCIRHSCKARLAGSEDGVQISFDLHEETYQW